LRGGGEVGGLSGTSVIGRRTKRLSQKNRYTNTDEGRVDINTLTYETQSV
jgi:hypothetical protein